MSAHPALSAAVSVACRRGLIDAVHRQRALVAGAVGLTAASLLGVAHPAFAQAKQPAAEPQNLEEIVVTGSRIRRTTDFDTSNPTTVVDDTFIKNLGIVNVGEAIAQLPSNVSNFRPETTGNSNFFAGSTVANLRGLNPFFGSRTLTLINTRRFVPTNQGDGVDLNFIPSILIDHIDSVTGGASAAYGSGAISGVQNIFLNRRLDGVRLDVDTYQTTEGDGQDNHVAFGFGTAFSDDRGHVVVGAEHEKSDAVACLDRAWCQKGVGFITGGANMPSNVLASDVRNNQISYTGVFNNFVPGATTAQQADAAGTAIVPFNIGQGFPTATGDTATSTFNNVVGGDGISIYQYTNLTAPVDRNVVTGMLTYAFNNKMTMSIDTSWGKVETVNINGGLNDQFSTIQPDNAYVQLNPGLQAAVGPFGALLNKNWTSQTDPHSVFTTDVKRAAIGFDGPFGGSSWTWEAYYQYGKTNREQLVADNRHLNAYLMAMDSVLDASGNPVCRVTRDGFAAAAAVTPGYALADPRIAQGCVPLDPFGNQPIPQAAKDYSFGFLDENLDYKQEVAAFDASGDIWKGMGAGPFQLAAGVEYRTELGHNIGSQNGAPDWVRTDYLIQYGESFSGKVDVTESFLELNTPLLRDKPGARRLEFNTAVRSSRYDNTGLAGTTGESRSHSFDTWKISGIYDPLEWLRFRASRSRDLRAANFRELYYGQLIHAGGAFGYCGPAGTFQADPCDWSLEGNVDLKPESADTKTFGIVITPVSRAKGFQIALDAFDIQIEDAIQQANIRRVLDGCQISNLPEFCALIVPDVPGVYTYDPAANTGIDQIRALSFNGSGYRYKGVDLAASYMLKLSGEGSVDFRLLGTHMGRQEFQPTPGQPFINVVGQTGTSNSFLSDYQPAADWTANLSTTYSRSKASLTGQIRYVSSGVLNYYGVTPGDAGYPLAPPYVTMDTNSVGAYSVMNLSGSYDFDLKGGTQMQVFATINNLTDKDPPIAAGSGFGGNGNGGTNPVFYDAVGRAVRVGLRVSF
jgi:iron complex outermembrane recepter protein